MASAHQRAINVVPAFLVLFIAHSVCAAELLPPLSLSAVGVSSAGSSDAAAPPGSLTTCPVLAPPSGPIVPGRLVVRDTDRPDVGPYTVKLPGYGTGSEALGQDSYRPFLVTAAPGDTLRFDVINQLGTDAPLGGTVNLHTHGLITSPRPCTPLGDYVFAETQPGTITSYRVDVPPTLPGYMYGSQATPQRYPSGLEWFHAHVHEKTRDDIIAGQSGMLYVGDLTADLLAVPGLEPASASALANADVLYLALRDIQLAVPRGATPDRVQPGQRAQWLNGASYDPNACLSNANPPIPIPGGFSGPGYCGHHGAPTSGGADASQDMVWLYTVNGQSNPTVTMQPGRNQVWRIANMSADVAYVLELVDQATGRAETLNLVALDGLPSGTSEGGSDALQVGVPLTRVLLMPARRIELLVTNAGGAGGRHLTLRTRGITTGASGSHWPKIDLAQVSMPPGSQPAASGTTTFRATMPMMAPTPVTPVSTIGNAGAPENCITLPAGTTPVRRRITFANNASGNVFLIGSEVVDAYGRSVDAQHTIPPQPFPMQAMLAPNSVPHICPRLGTQEVWEVVNYTGELHNFHIHQSKFRLARQSDAGAPARLMAVQDPTSILAQNEPELQAATPAANVDVWYDTFPLPPYGGRIFVTIPFYAPQQVGDFVYHCHILSHEDAGMMAVVQVFDPTRLALNDDPSRFDSLVRSTICGLPNLPASPLTTASVKILDTVRVLAASAFGLAKGPAARWSGMASVE